jgi:hypothetical protein
MQSPIKSHFIGMAAGLSLILLTSSTGYSGDREWATAGKILTGVVAANVISNVICPTRTITVDRQVYHTNRPVRYYNRCKPIVRSYSYYETRNYCPPPRISYKTIEYDVKPDCSDLVIVNIDNGRRIIQPRIHGATAYMQVYSQVTCEWVTIEEYPSIW